MFLTEIKLYKQNIIRSSRNAKRENKVDKMGKDGEKSVYKRLYRERKTIECNSIQSA